MKLGLAVTFSALLAVGCTFDTAETKPAYTTVNALGTPASDAIQGREESQQVEYPMLRFDSPGNDRTNRGGYGEH